MINFVVLIIAIAIAVVGIFMLINGKTFPAYSIATIVLGVAVFIVGLSFTVIPTGYTGIRVTLGQIDEKPLNNGLAWAIPVVQRIEKVDNRQQDITIEGQIWSETSERTALYYDGITVTYRISPERSSWIYANVANYKNTLVSNGLVASAIKTASKTLSSTDATNRGIIEPLTMQVLQEQLDEKYGDNSVILTKVIVNNADFEESYNNAIAQKQNAQLEYERQQIENKKSIEAAEASAKVKITQSNADAEAKLIQAEAEAKANGILKSSLDDIIFKERFYSKWDGKLPSVISDTEILNDISTLVE